MNGDCRDMLRTLPDGSVHCCISSPPYWGLRDYGTGTWEGGDPLCDHIKDGRHQSQGANSQRQRRSNADAQRNETFLTLCGKCGARRVDRQLGLEPDYRDHIAAMVEVFREVRRVLRPDGTLWLNYGDCYASSVNGRSAADTEAVGNDDRTFRDKPFSTVQGVLKPKDLVMMPARIAIALQEDGWWLRSDIIWSKPNPMPESITDRPATSHEHVFLFAKSGNTTFWTHRDGGSRKQPEPDYRWIHKETGEERTEEDPDPSAGPVWRRINLWRGRDYFYDAEAIAEPSSPGSHARMSQDVERQIGSFRANGGGKTNGPMKAVAKKLAAPGSGIRYNGSYDSALTIRLPSRNARSVWTIVTQSFSEAHFATFPPDLAERCIKAGTSERGCCSACGAPWSRIIIKGEPDMAHRLASGADAAGGYNGQSIKDHDAHGVQNASDVKRRILDGMREKTYDWRPTCQCDASVVPCTILDPFAGAFTSLLVADRLQRSGIGIELNPEYCEMARRRVAKDAGLFAEFAAETPAPQVTRPNLFT